MSFSSSSFLCFIYSFLWFALKHSNFPGGCDRRGGLSTPALTRASNPKLSIKTKVKQNIRETSWEICQFSELALRTRICTFTQNLHLCSLGQDERLCLWRISGGGWRKGGDECLHLSVGSAGTERQLHVSLEDEGSLGQKWLENRLSQFPDPALDGCSVTACYML